MPVSDASAKRAAAWLAAWHRAGLLGTDPEVVGFVADLIQFVGERAMDEKLPDWLEQSVGDELPKIEVVACGYRSGATEADELLDRVRELEAENARLRAGEIAGRTGYEVAAEWRDRCKAAEARVRELEAEVAELRRMLDNAGWCFTKDMPSGDSQ